MLPGSASPNNLRAAGSITNIAMAPTNSKLHGFLSCSNFTKYQNFLILKNVKGFLLMFNMCNMFGRYSIVKRRPRPILKATHNNKYDFDFH